MVLRLMPEPIFGAPAGKAANSLFAMALIKVLVLRLLNSKSQSPKRIGFAAASMLEMRLFVMAHISNCRLINWLNLALFAF